MNRHQTMVGEAGLQFFGKITASISHEIRNVLAVLNENAGLVTDYVLMAEKGIPLDPERLKTLAQSMGTQIRRADGIVENMNRFAHGVDEKSQQIDLNETIDLLVALSSRLADMRGVKIESVCGNDPVEIITHPFFMENMLWYFLDFAMGVVGDSKTLQIVGEMGASGVHIRFGGLDKLAQTDSEGFPSAEAKALLTSLEADFSMNPEAGEILIQIAK